MPDRAIVVGSGPNGLAAAVTLARAGVPVEVYERSHALGGGAHTAEVTLPGFRHDICSAVHPMALVSRFFGDFGLTERVRFVNPDLAYAQAITPERAALAWRDLERTADGLGRDGPAWRALLRPFVDHADRVADLVSGALHAVPDRPWELPGIVRGVLEQGTRAGTLRWREEEAPALLAGVLAHTIRPLPSLSTAAAGMVLAGAAHVGGWPIPVGGSQAIADAMADDARAHGATLTTGVEVRSLADLPAARAVLFDTTPRALVRIAGDRLPAGYARRLLQFRYGDGAAKVDFALAGPVPWAAAGLREAGTIHLGGTREETTAAEGAVARGYYPERPYVLVAQPSVHDPTRAPAGRHVLWAYTHVPHGSTRDMTEAITARIERFAPGFRDLVLASTAHSAAQLEHHNPNYVGGDIAAGAVSLPQLLARPVLAADPWRAPGGRGLYLCSASTSPGPGVHGIGGWRAALSALRHEYGIDRAPVLAP